jgi:hypothetical protein
MSSLSLFGDYALLKIKMRLFVTRKKIHLSLKTHLEGTNLSFWTYFNSKIFISKTALLTIALQNTCHLHVNARQLRVIKWT